MKIKIITSIFSLCLLGLLSVFVKHHAGNSGDGYSPQEAKVISADVSVNETVGNDSGLVFDPKKCKKSSEGIVYWAAGSHLFKFPYVESQKIYARAGTQFETEVDVLVNDPTDQDGCSGNPLRGGVMPYMAELSRVFWEQISGKPFAVGPNSGATFGARASGINYAKNNPDEFLKYFGNADNCVEREPGFFECFATKTADVNALISRQIRISGKARGSLDGGDLYVSAISNDAKTSLTIRAGFGMYDNAIRINYVFEVQPEDLPHLVKFDRIITAMIRKAHQ